MKQETERAKQGPGNGGEGGSEEREGERTGWVGGWGRGTEREGETRRWRVGGREASH